MQPDKVKILFRNIIEEMVGADRLISPLPLTNNRKTCLKERSTEKTSAKHGNEHHDTTCEKPYKSPWINTISLQDDYQSDFQVT